MTVYISQCVHNLQTPSGLEPAKQFGDIKIIETDHRAQMSDINAPAFAAAYAQVLKDFDQKHDYLVCGLGDPAQQALAVALVSEITNGYFKVLKWDRLGKFYYPVQIDLNRAYEIKR